MPYHAHRLPAERGQTQFRWHACPSSRRPVVRFDRRALYYLAFEDRPRRSPPWRRLAMPRSG